MDGWMRHGLSVSVLSRSRGEARRCTSRWNPLYTDAIGAVGTNGADDTDGDPVPMLCVLRQD